MYWKLEDVEKANRLNLNSFFIPSQLKRHEQRVGNLVRLHFLLTNRSEDDPRAERMLVEITECTNQGQKYKGILTNKPEYIKMLDVGDSIDFEARHIARVFINNDDPFWLECGEQAALVSGNVLKMVNL